jgi:hypothetical protein
MRVACQAPASVAGAFVCKLTAEGEDEGQDTFEERLAIVKQVIVGRFIVEIDGNGAVFSCLCGGFPHVSPQVLRSCELTRDNGEKFLKYQK